MIVLIYFFDTLAKVFILIFGCFVIFSAKFCNDRVSVFATSLCLGSNLIDIRVIFKRVVFVIIFALTHHPFHLRAQIYRNAG